MTDPQHKVLLVDDDKFLADMYSMKFTESGYDVNACLSVADAISALRGGFAPEAILFDIVMPGQDGYAFLQTLKNENLGAGAVKIALTNQSDDTERQKAIELGADHYIVKASMIPSEVVATVRDALAKKGGSRAAK